MSLFKDWFAKKDRPKVTDLERDAIDRIDRFDREDFEAIDKAMKAFRLGRHELEDFAETGGHLWSDNFFEFVKADPQLKPPDRMRPTYLINHVVAEEFMKLSEYDRLRTWTQGDVVSAAMACAAMKDDLIALYDRAKQQKDDEDDGPDGCGGLPGGSVEGGIDEYNFTEDGVRSMEDMIDAWKNLAELDPTPELEARSHELDEALEKAKADLKVMAGILEGKMDKLETDVRGLVRTALPGLRADMTEEADWNEKLAEAAAGWGVEPGELQKMDYAQRTALAERLVENPRVKDLTELIGAMKRTALDCQKRKVNYLPQEVYDVTMGNDLQRLLPQELVALANPLLKLDFYSRYNESKLLQYKMRGSEKLAKGGIIFCMDNSQSMEGDKEVWAKAVGLATLAIAREQKRSFYGIHFSSRSQLKCFDFRKPEDITLDGVLEYAEHFFCGGPLRVDQRVVTPNGWREIGTLLPGENVFGPDGEPTTVLGVYPQGVLDLHKVTFKDGAEVVCDGSHLWTVLDRGTSGKNVKDGSWRTASLTELVNDGIECRYNGHRFSVPMTDAVRYPRTQQVLDPYLLGYLLGNGGFTQSSPTVTPTPGDEHPWEPLLPAGVTAHNTEKREDHVPTYQLTAGPRGGRSLNPLTEALRSLGLWGHDASSKFIPENYLRGAIGQRWALLQGLADSDGHYDGPGRVEYGTTSEKLARDVVELAQSLGSVATLRPIPPRYPNDQTFYKVHIVLNGLGEPFRLARKIAMWDQRHHEYIRSIVKVERVLSGEAVCILVDRADGLFLTEGFVVTHNTDFEAPLGRALALLAEEFKAEGFVEGDIILATDGICGVSPAFMTNFKSEQERIGFRVYGLAIGCSRKSEPLWTIADEQVVTITDLLTGEDVKDLFRAL